MPVSRRALRQADSVPAQRERQLTRRELRALTDPGLGAVDAAVTHHGCEPEPWSADESAADVPEVFEPEAFEPEAFEPLPSRGPGADRQGGFVPAPLETAAAPFGSPAVLMDAPVLPALRPVDGTALPTPRPAPLPAPVVVTRPAPAVADRPAAEDEEPLSLAERIAALPVAPGVVQIDLEAIPHPSEPLDNKLPRRAPHPTAPSPLPARRSGPAVPAARPEALAPAFDGAGTGSLRDGGPVDLLESGKRPGPPAATWAMWLGIGAVLVWVLGPVAIGFGAWTLRLARLSGYSLARPLTGLIGGVLGTVLAATFVAFGM